MDELAFGSFSYRDLIARANGLCSAPLIMEKQIETFNKARNCRTFRRRCYQALLQ